MFVHDFVHVAHPAETVQSRVLAHLDRWLPLLAEAASEGNQALVGEAHPSAASRATDTHVLIGCSRGQTSASTLVVPTEWRAARPGGVFPNLRADLEVSPLGPAHARLSVMGRYEAPLLPADRAVEGLLLHGLVEAAIRSFLRCLAEQVSIVEDEESSASAPPRRSFRTSQGSPHPAGTGTSNGDPGFRRAAGGGACGD